MAKCIAALAIEDRVDFRFTELNEEQIENFENGARAFLDELDRPIIDEDRATSDRTVDIPGRILDYRSGARNFLFRKRIDGPDYFKCVADHIHSALQALHEAFAVKGGTSPLDEIAVFVVSTAGVVRDGRVLVQLPLWSWPATEQVEWTDGGELKRGFDFSEVIASAVASITGRANRQLAGNVFVYNDTVASAAFNYASLEADEKNRRQVFLKVHKGVNAAYVLKDAFDGDDSAFQPSLLSKPTHPEFGHLFPVMHPADLKNGFGGVCPYHASCMEGVLSRRSFLERALPSQSRPVSGWARHAVGQTPSDQERALFQQLIKNAPPRDLAHPSRDSTDAIDFASFYIAQLVHILLASPIVPDRVLLGGAFATEAILQAVRKRVHLLAGGYPVTIFGARDDPSPLDKLIRLADAGHVPHVELNGALYIGTRRLSSSPRGKEN